MEVLFGGDGQLSFNVLEVLRREGGLEEERKGSDLRKENNPGAKYPGLFNVEYPGISIFSEAGL